MEVLKDVLANVAMEVDSVNGNCSCLSKRKTLKPNANVVASVDSPFTANADRGSVGPPPAVDVESHA